MALITVANANAHLRLDLQTSGSPAEFDDERLDELQLKMVDAEAIVTDYIKNPDHEWTDETVPFVVRASILLVLASLWEHRGDDPADAANVDLHLTVSVRALLHRMRDPALA